MKLKLSCSTDECATARLFSIFWYALALAIALPISAGAAAPRASDLELERAVLLIRHGIRAPLPGESPVLKSADAWPRWGTPPGELTKRGFRGARLLAEYMRTEWIRRGLLQDTQCASQEMIHVRANSLPRTIASGRALLDALSPGCELPLEHRPVGTLDPLFSSIAAGAVEFDPAAALSAVEHSAPSARSLVNSHLREFRMLGRVLGCDRGPAPCDVVKQFDRNTLAAEGTGVRIEGAIRVGAGVAQTLMLQYLEGFPSAEVGWGRVSAREIERLSVLHSLPFALEARPPYLAHRIATPFLRDLADRLRSDHGPRVAAFVGHDSNVSAVASVLSFDFKAPGYARNDPPVGGGLIFELLRSPQSGEHFVRTVYIAQTPAQLRNLTLLSGENEPYQAALEIAACRRVGRALCTLEQFLDLIAIAQDEGI